MKNLIYIIVTLWFIIPSFAADANAPTPNTNVIQNITTKDAFLKFVLEKAEKYSDTGEKAINKAIDTITEETPLIVKEFIIWRIWKHAVVATIPVGLMLFFSLLVYKCYPKAIFNTSTFGSDWNKEATICLISFIFGGMSTIVFFVDSIGEYLDLIQAIVAPRIYILEQLMNFIKH